MGQLKEGFPMDSVSSSESNFPSNYNISEKAFHIESSQLEDSKYIDEKTLDDTENNLTDHMKFGSSGAGEEYTAAKEEEVLKQPKFVMDTGQRIADMNVEGMPWFHDPIEEEELQARREIPELNGRETRRFIYSSLLASMMVAGIFILALFLFLLFCTKIWF